MAIKGLYFTCVFSKRFHGESIVLEGQMLSFVECGVVLGLVVVGCCRALIMQRMFGPSLTWHVHGVVLHVQFIAQLGNVILCGLLLCVSVFVYACPKCIHDLLKLVLGLFPLGRYEEVVVEVVGKCLYVEVSCLLK